MATAAAVIVNPEKSVEIENEENSIDEEQLEEYREEVEELGSFPVSPWKKGKFQCTLYYYSSLNHV
jgi:hypothetical protein